MMCISYPVCTFSAGNFGDASTQFALCSDKMTIFSVSTSTADFPVAVTEVFTVGSGNNRAVFTDQQIWWLGAQ